MSAGPTLGGKVGIRSTAVRVLPSWAISRLRRVYRLLHPTSMVSRELRLVTWVRRHILRQRPVLYHFEIHVTDHCNLNCKGCAHFSNLCKPAYADLGEFETDMRSMARVFSAVRQIYLLGGEPLLHPDVAAFVRVARSVFPRTRIYLMTNGTLVTRMGEDVWRALADTGVVLLCDSYPIGLPVDEINRLGQLHGARVEWTVSREQFFRIPIDPSAAHDPDASFAACECYNNCPIVRDGRLYPCAYAAYSDAFRDYFGVEGLVACEADSIAIRGGVDPWCVMEFLRSSVPWCAHCDMDAMTFVEWGRSSRTIDEWSTLIDATEDLP